MISKRVAANPRRHYAIPMLSKNQVKRLRRLESRDNMAIALAVPRYYDVMMKQFKAGSLYVVEVLQ